jgi:hypothetical protein
VLWSLAYLVVRCLFGGAVLVSRSRTSKELEIMVLRHEVSILRLKGVNTRVASRLRGMGRIGGMAFSFLYLAF